MRRLVLLLVLAAACDGTRTSPGDGLELRDIPRFEVEPAPTLTLGLDPPSEEYVFVEITGGGIVDDSLIVVVDRNLKRVGVYGIDGGFRRWIIREGGGPGEVESIYASGVLPDGRVWVYDLQRLRVLAVDVEGDVISEASLPVEDPRDFLHMEVIGPGRDGSWWLRRNARDFDQEPGTLVRIRTELLRLDRDGALDTIWSGEGDLAMLLDARQTVLEGTPANRTTIHRLHHFPRLHFEATGRGILMAWSDSGWVDRIASDGSRDRIGAIPTARIPVPDQDAPEGAPSALEAAYGLDRYYSEIARLLLDPEGGVWVYRPPGDQDLAASDEPVRLYRLSDDGPDRAISSHLRRIATTLSRTWVLIEGRHPETEEQYVSLHRLVPLEGGER